jgi:hypothetical protein
VKTRVDPVLRDEARRFAFRFACDDCAHWTGTACGNAWPTFVPQGAIDEGDEVVFCKEFELGAPLSAPSPYGSTPSPSSPARNRDEGDG